MNVFDFQNKKNSKEKITLLTCYDYTFARLLNDSKVDAILVGDSLAMVMHGHQNTITASMEMMALHTAAVAKGAPNKFVIGDLPFMSYRKDLQYNMTNIEILMKAGAQAVKLEGAIGNLDLIRHTVQSGIPLMGHIGLTPQMVNSLAGHRVQGRNEKDRIKILDHAKQLEDAGCFSIVLECVPLSLAKEITDAVKVPTIGIGAGVHTDGQVLVLQDLLGMNDQFSPKFLRKYLPGADLIKSALNEFCLDVESGLFPTDKESYHD